MDKMEPCRDCRNNILSAVREPVIVLNHELLVQTANHSFLDTFQVSVEETLNRHLYEVGNGQWNFPEVHTLLRFMLRDTAGPLRRVIEHDFERVGYKSLQINCCRLDEDPGLILFALHELSPDAKYRRLFETALDGILVVDAGSGRITDANQSMTDLLGCSREQLMGRRFWEVEPLSGTPLGPEGFDRVRTEGVVRFPVVSFQTRSGRSVEIEVIGNISEGWNSQSVQFNLRDITERRLYDRKSQLEARQESLITLAGGIAHDFNNLLAVIMGYATLALSDAPGESRYRGALNAVIAASQRGADLTRQMLAYSGNDHFVFRRIDLSEIVREARSFVKTSLPKFVALEVDLGAEPLFVNADAARMKQVITNLVINGTEAVPRGEAGHVRVTARQEHVDEEYIRRSLPAGEMSPGTFVVLEVADSGFGMDSETQARIFDPFFSTKFTGRGLGLAAALGIVKGHGGSILVKNRAGGGTTFQVFLPFAGTPS